MIEINLLPDVKRTLLKARRLRTTVTSMAIVISIVAVGVVVLLGMYVFGVQSVLQLQADGSIKSEFDKLSKVEDLSKTLTIQNQLSSIDALHGKKVVGSRVFEILATAVPTGKNAITITKLDLNNEEGTITINATAKNGYEALEVFKKTLAQTTFEYSEGDDSQSVNLASDITDGERQFGETGRDGRSLSFSLSFVYAPELFNVDSKNGRVIAPTRQNATDSATGVPKSLFGGTGENE